MKEEDNKQSEDNELPENSIRYSKGLSLGVTSLFVVGQVAGSGVLALPKAFLDTGWGGVLLVLFCWTISVYAAICLGRSWSILEERFEEYRGENRYPYPVIAYRAFGTKTQILTSICIVSTNIGISIVLLLLSSHLIASVTAAWGITFCYWILIIAFVLCPLMWLGTPKDFWQVALLAVLTTALACAVFVVLTVMDIGNSKGVQYPNPTLESFFLAFGTMVFAFGGANSFPTYQNDMKNRHDFPKAVLIGFIVTLCLYMPVAILGYYVYGDKVTADLTNSLSPSIPKIVIRVLLAFHMIFAFLLAINPSLQNIEESLNIPKRFGWKRCLLRTLVMLFIVFVANSIPKFEKILNLIGSTGIALTCTIFPCLFYYRLSSQRDENWPERNISIYEKAWLIAIILIGVISGIISTYAAMKDIAGPNTFHPPCYINATAANIL